MVSDAGLTLLCSVLLFGYLFDVPHPCPLECTSRSSKCLDYPFMIALGGELGTLVLMLIAAFVAVVRSDSSWLDDFLLPLRLLRFCWIITAIVAMLLAVKKYRIMRLQMSRVSGIPISGDLQLDPGPGTVAVVGLPVSLRPATADSG